jgi:hypothetical protein
MHTWHKAKRNEILKPRWMRRPRSFKTCLSPEEPRRSLAMLLRLHLQTRLSTGRRCALPPAPAPLRSTHAAEALTPLAVS